MPRRRSAVSALAAEAGLDLDEAIVTLWDAGIDEVEEGTDVLPATLVRPARRALGLESKDDQFKVDYWVKTSGLARDELSERLLRETGVRLSPQARKIPKNSYRKLRRLFGGETVVQEETKPPPAPIPPLQWDQIGHGRPTRFLEAAEVKSIHEALEEEFRASNDPIVPAGIRDENLLESAITRPSTSFGDTFKYQTEEMACAALFHSLVHNHAFHNGNKRTALVSMLVFLDENGAVLMTDETELFRFTLRTAQHRLVPPNADQLPDREVLAIARWIAAKSRPIERGERPMKWIRLKQRLRDFGCRFETSKGVGNRLNIIRTIDVKRRLGRPKTRTLHTQVRWAGDGTEAERNTLHKIRADLELDDTHDCDSGTFYAGSEIDSFIIDHRRILQRLAKL